MGHPHPHPHPHPDPSDRGATGDQRTLRHSMLAFAVAALAGALIWGAWLGWDRTASYDVVTATVQSPYVTLQVLGCALTVGVVVALLAARRLPVTGAGGVAAGFWVGWTVDAAATDDTGLFAVGSLLLGWAWSWVRRSLRVWVWGQRRWCGRPDVGAAPYPGEGPLPGLSLRIGIS